MDESNDLSEDLQDVEVIYLEDGLEDEDGIEEMGDDAQFNETTEQNDIEDLSKLTFIKHSKSVFSCDLTKDGQVAVTGGEDDTAFLWSTSSGEVIFECTGHKDSVTAVCFNYDNQLLATGDMAGMIQVWNIKDQKLVWCYEGDDMEWLMWHPLTNVLMAGSQAGEIYIWQVLQGNCKVLPSHGSSCTSGKVLPDGKRLLVGYEDGQVKLWDIKAASVVWTVLAVQNGGVTSLEINSDGTLASVAPSSSLLKLVDGKLLGTLLVEGESEIESHAFDSELNVLITGSLSGQLCVWDLSKHMIRHQAKIECAVTVLKLGLKGKVFIGATDGVVYVCDVRTGTLLEALTGHKADILSISVFTDACSVLTTSDDQTAKIFKIKS